jgi:hypothetical protein
MITSPFGTEQAGGEWSVKILIGGTSTLKMATEIFVETKDKISTFDTASRICTLNSNRENLRQE